MSVGGRPLFIPGRSLGTDLAAMYALIQQVGGMRDFIVVPISCVVDHRGCMRIPKITRADLDLADGVVVGPTQTIAYTGKFCQAAVSASPIGIACVPSTNTATAWVHVGEVTLAGEVVERYQTVELPVMVTQDMIMLPVLPKHMRLRLESVKP